MAASRALRCLAVVGALFAFDALAGRQPQHYQEPTKLTEEELRQLKDRSRSNLNAFGETMEEKPKPFPWLAVSLAGVCFLVATPFALRAYRATAGEIAGNRTSSRRKLDENDA